MTNLEFICLAKSDSKRSEQLASPTLPKLIECVLYDTLPTDIEQEVGFFEPFKSALKLVIHTYMLISLANT
jgi:hypothetical protein